MSPGAPAPDPTHRSGERLLRLPRWYGLQKALFVGDRQGRHIGQLDEAELELLFLRLTQLRSSDEMWVLASAQVAQERK